MKRKNLSEMIKNLSGVGKRFGALIIALSLSFSFLSPVRAQDTSTTTEETSSTEETTMKPNEVDETTTEEDKTSEENQVAPSEVPESEEVSQPTDTTRAARVARAAAQGTGASQNDPYMMDDAPEVANPFPDVVSDALINQVVASVTTKVKDESDLYINRIVFELKDGSKVPVTTSDLRGEVFTSLDILQKHVNDIAKIHWYMVMPESTDQLDVTYFARILAISSKGAKQATTQDEYDLNDLTLSELEVNGESVPTTRTWYKWKNGIHKRTYFKATFEARSNLEYLWFYSYPIQQGSSGSGHGGHAALYWKFLVLMPRATFHYVDEMQYRTMMGLKPSDSVTERSNGAFWDATEPATQKDLTDIKTPLTLSGQTEGRSLYNYRAIPYFNLPGGSVQSTKFSEDGSEIISGEVKPTYQEAIHDTPVGYTYIADDIDKPDNTEDPNSFNPSTEAGKGNYYLTPVILPNGTMVFDKHYYILSRELPSPIKVNNIDDKDKAVVGSKFDLYRLVPKTDEKGQIHYEEVLLDTNLTTDENGYVHKSTSTSVAYSDIEALAGPTGNYDPSLGYLVKDDLAYMLGGKYRLKQTKAPEDYKLENVDFEISPVSTLVDSKEADVPVQNVTVINKNKTMVKYEFVSEDGQDLPDEVKALLPTDNKEYVAGDKVSPIQLAQTSIKVAGGTWQFVGFDPESFTVDKNSPRELVFTGTWKFVKGDKTTSVKRTPKTGIHSDTNLWLSIGLLAAIVLVASFVMKKIRR